jgi:hypothetical protein
MRIGVIAEGVTDHRILEDILIGYFDDEDALEYRALQPVLDATDQSIENKFGSWTHVIKYCESHEKLRMNLLDFDILLIQIDSDVCEKLKIDRTGKETPQEVVEKVKKRLIAAMSTNLYKEFESKILFAISVDMIECWLLPVYESNKKKQAKITGCIPTLNNALKSHPKIKFFIDEKNKNYAYYEVLTEPLIKRKNLTKYYPLNPSFALFYAELESKIIIV